MNRAEALSMVKQALDNVSPGLSESVTEETHLTNEDIVDSLDAMNFLFELETLNGQKIAAVDDAFENFQVSNIMDILCNQQQEAG